MRNNILIVDDEPDIRKILMDLFMQESYGVFAASSAKEALEILAREDIDVVISDELMPGMPGSEFLAVVRKEFPDTIRMILTGHASIQAAIRAINEGEIYRFFTKPCNVVDLAMTVRQALEHKELMKESQRLLKAMKSQSAFIEELEERYPGITKVDRNEAGVIVLDDNCGDKQCDSLIEQIGETVKKYEGFFDTGR